MTSANSPMPAPYKVGKPAAKSGAQTYRPGQKHASTTATKKGKK